MDGRAGCVGLQRGANGRDVAVGRESAKLLVTDKFFLNGCHGGLRNSVE